MLHLGPGEVAVAVVDGLELAAINGHEGVGEQVEVAAQDNELTAHPADRFAVILAEVGNGLEVWRQAAGQPHQFHVTLRFAFQPPARLHPVEIAVDEQLEHGRRVISRTTRIVGLGLEAKIAQVEFIDEHIDHPYRAVFGYIVIEAFGKQRRLSAVFALNESAHGASLRGKARLYQEGFHTASVSSGNYSLNYLDGWFRPGADAHLPRSLAIFSSLKRR